jgi:predicted CXXCH cytochrome family protein
MSPGVIAAVVMGTVLALAASASPATFVGSDRCASCHAEETAAWSRSHHALAMAAPSDATVRGRFDGATVTKDGVTTTFSRDGDRWMVRTDGPDGAVHDYPVAWTFGWAPLQQYLLALPGGRLQALPIAWDVEGKRWYDLYPDERVHHRDELHWTGVQQNWNFMCAECHSTNLVKGYQAGADRFETTWTDVNVACEACHGPGSDHVERPAQRMPVDLSAPGAWSFANGAAIARRTAPRPGVQLETCGRCHARAAQVWADDPPGTPLAQTHRVTLLDPGLYHADGQIEGEVYEYGSFVQSRMHAADVTCSDCHEAHGGGLRAEGNALCAQCHRPDVFDVAAHHHHPPGTPGAACVACHMPERVYMGIDRRRDHGLRVPRPDLTVAIGVPNACADCHGDRPATWAAETVQGWRGDRAPAWHWAEAIHAGRAGAPRAAALLERAIDDKSVPGIARATAVGLLAQPRPETLERVAADPDPLVRRAAADAAMALPPPQRVSIAVPLLRDPMRTVRFEALGTMLDAPIAGMGDDVRDALARVIAEYREAQAYNADRAEAWLNLGMLESRLGNADASRTALGSAIRRQPAWGRPYVELADLERRQGREGVAETTLRQAVLAAPRDADVWSALGLSLVRQRRTADALRPLRIAAKLGTRSPRHAYVYAIALHDGGDVRGALRMLRRTHDRHPQSADVVMALAQYSAEVGDRAAALAWARTLAAMTGDPGAQALVDSLAR